MIQIRELGHATGSVQRGKIVVCSLQLNTKLINNKSLSTMRLNDNNVETKMMTTKYMTRFIIIKLLRRRIFIKDPFYYLDS